MNNLQHGKILFFIFCYLCFFQQYTLAESARYELAPASTSTPHPIQFTLGYTLGTHTGKADEGGEGYITFDPGSIESMKGGFKIPIDSIHTGNATRDCHLRESLGLNYASAGYPQKHLCDNQDRLPLSGPQSIQYGDVSFSLEKAVFASPTHAAAFARNHQAQIYVTGTWKIHGQSKTLTIPMTIELAADGKTLLAQGNFPLHFGDFGIIVKPARVLAFEITVEEKVQVALDLVLHKI